MKAVPEPLDGRDLVPLRGFVTRSEVEIVLALLKSSGITAVFSNRYNPRIPKGELQILVPRKDWEDSKRVIATARQSSVCAAEPERTKPRILKVLMGCVLLYLFFGIIRMIFNMVAQMLAR
jgi:hypothetical protein